MTMGHASYHVLLLGVTMATAAMWGRDAEAQCQYELSIVAGPDCDGFGSPTRGESINEAGIVAGYYTLCGLGASRTFLWDGGPDLITLQHPPGVGGSRPWEISNTDLLAGTMSVTDVGERAFLHDGMGFIDLGVPSGAVVSAGRGLNDQGDVVGKWGTGVHAFLYRDGMMIDLGSELGHPSSDALDINNAGQVVGWMGNSFSDAIAYIWQDGVVTDLGVIPGGFTAQARAINSAGQVVGSGRVRTDKSPFVATRTFLWDGETMINLGTLPGFELGGAFDINDLGQIVGRAWGFGGNPNIESAFIWQNGVMTDLNDLITESAGVHVTVAKAINNQAQITGQADGAFGDLVAFLLTPIDQPLGDLDGDCNVGITDFLELLSQWGPCNGCAADLDGDGVVGIIDFLLLLTNWG